MPNTHCAPQTTTDAVQILIKSGFLPFISFAFIPMSAQLSHSVMPAAMQYIECVMWHSSWAFGCYIVIVVHSVWCVAMCTCKFTHFKHCLIWSKRVDWLACLVRMKESRRQRRGGGAEQGNRRRFVCRTDRIGATILATRNRWTQAMNNPSGLVFFKAASLHHLSLGRWTRTLCSKPHLIRL